MISVNTNITFMSQQNLSRLNLLAFDRTTEHLETGLQVNKGADDPSGLAMSGNMDAQVRGINTAIQNIQDDINSSNGRRGY